MTKQELDKQLKEALERIINEIESKDETLFDKEIFEGKWTLGQHIEHLNISMSAVNKAMQVPKLLLRYKFGVCNRDERTYDQLITKYKAKLAEGPVLSPARFRPDNVSFEEREKVVNKLKQETAQMQKAVQKWSEKNLSKYILPHPLLGKLTIREMIAFSALHLDHHRMILKDYN